MRLPAIGHLRAEGGGSIRVPLTSSAVL